MLMTVREYALECLREQGELAIAQEAHAGYYLALAEEAELHLRDAGQLIWLAMLEQEQENMRAALQWLVGQQQTVQALRLCGSLGRFWLICGYLTEGQYWMKAALKLPSVPGDASARAGALLCAGENALMLGEMSNARAWMTESLALYRTLQDKRGMAQAAGQLGRLLHSQSDFVQGRGLLEESLILSREVGEQWMLAFALHNLGRVLWQQNDLAGASVLVEESVSLYRQIGDGRELAVALGTLARFAIAKGNAPNAFALWNEELALLRTLHDRLNLVNVLNHSGYLLWSHGNMAQAEAHLHESQATAQEIGYRNGLAQAKSYLAQLERARGNLELAARFAKESLVLFRELGEPLVITYLLNVLGEIQRDMGELAKAKDSFMEGFLIAQQVGYEPYLGWHLYGFATVAIVEKQPARAACLLGAAERLLDDELNADPLEREHYERQLARLRAQLSEEEMQSAWTIGRAMTPVEALAVPGHAANKTSISAMASVASSSIPTFSSPPASVTAHSSLKPLYPNDLTPRELDVLRLLAQGWTDPQIAEHLFISPRTVNRYTTSIYSKIQVTTRSAATRYAIEKKIV